MVRILLAEDAHMVRGALVALLSLEPDFEIVAELARGDTIEAAAIKARPDVAILDIDLPGLDGLSAAEAMHHSVPECHTLILTSLARPGTLRRALSVHVGGFLLKDAPSAELAAAVRQVSRGERYIDRELALAAWDTTESPLTAREAEVLRLAGTGLDVSEIAGQLFLSIGTVRNYLAAAVTKMNARNRLDAVRIADQAGWLG